MTVEYWGGLRKNWVKARDAAKPKVAQGAVKGVSMGDAIDRVYKASQRDYTSLVAATSSLLKDAEKYKTAIKAKNPDLVKWIDANIVNPATQLLNDANADAKMLQDGMKFLDLSNRRDAVIPHDIVRLASQVDDEKKSLKTVSPQDYAQLIAWWKCFRSVEVGMKKIAQDLKLDVRKDETRKKLVEDATTMNHYTVLFQGIIKASDGPGFTRALRGNTDAPDHLWRLVDGSRAAMKTALKAS